MDLNVKKFERRMNRLAAQGNPVASAYATKFREANATDAPEAAKRQIKVEFEALFAQVAEWAAQFHAAIEKAVGKETGLTLDDYLWIRDFDPPEEDRVEEA